MQPIRYRNAILSPKELLGKTMLIRWEGCVIPVYCYDATGDTFFGMQLRPRHSNDDVRTCWLLDVGDHGLREPSVAMVNRLRRFQMDDVIRVLGLVSSASLAKARYKRTQVERQPTMVRERQESYFKSRKKNEKDTEQRASTSDSAN